MRIACPACNAAYQVPDEQLAAGRVVRCARCGTEWAPLEEVPAAEQETAPEVQEAAVSFEPTVRPVFEAVFEPQRVGIEEDIPIPHPPALPAAPARSRDLVLLVMAWVVSVAAVSGAIGGLYAGRERVMQAWPPSARAYAALGLRHPAELERRE